MTNLLSKVTDFLGGSLFKEVKDITMSYFPPEMSEEDKLKLEAELDRALFNKQIKTQEMLNEAARQLDERIKEQEGTAKDLKSLPFVGRILLFARGAQRPIWGFYTMYLDFNWLFGTYEFTEQQNTALIVINFLVLGFLFGERTIKNLEPLIVKVFGGK